VVVATPQGRAVGGHVSTRRRVLLTGAGGQLGTDLQQAFWADDLHPLARADLDVTDRHAVEKAVDQISPELIVNAAAMTAVDACETETDRAWATNALAVRHLVEAAERTGARLVHYSTDYVFDGTASQPYTEWDRTNPQSMYGRSKLGGEHELRPGDLCIRVSWLVGEHGPNILKTVLSLAAGGQTLRFVDDQRGSPSFTRDVADLTRRLVDLGATGTYHGADQGVVSWYEYVGDMLEAAGRPREQVEPIATADLDPPRLAPRPAYSALDGAALRVGGLDPQPHYLDSLHDLVARLT
jgi:dTDP-4-dehydrorhamnose reductase